MVNLTFVHVWLGELRVVGAVVAATVLVYYPGLWGRRAIIRKWARR